MVGPRSETARSSKRSRKKRISLAAAHMAKYSASVLDMDTERCEREYHKMGTDMKAMMPPETENLVAQSAST